MGRVKKTPLLKFEGHWVQLTAGSQGSSGRCRCGPACIPPPPIHTIAMISVMLKFAEILKAVRTTTGCRSKARAT